MKKIWLLAAGIMLGSCALQPKEEKKEEKVRMDRRYPVELAHYEYEERLQTFTIPRRSLPSI